MENLRKPTGVAEYLIDNFDKTHLAASGEKISVDPVVSEVAAWYEKLRTAMDYRDDDVILRAAIERILKRRLLFGRNSKAIAEPLVRELIWARYFPDESVPESINQKVENSITLFLKLEEQINQKHKTNHQEIFEWIIHLLSSDIEHVLSPNKDKEVMANFMYQIYKDKLIAPELDDETKFAQVFIAVRRTFTKDDLALLRYKLFTQLFGVISEEKLGNISDSFLKAKKKITDELNHPLKDRIYTYIKKQTIPFFIMEDIFEKNKGQNKSLVHNLDQFKVAILNSCHMHYEEIRAKVGRAVLRGIIFIILTKAVIALLVEGSYESYVYGSIQWESIALNTLFPPLLMIIAGLFIKTPKKDNSERVFERIYHIIHSPENLTPLTIKKAGGKDPLMNLVFITLWVFALCIGLAAIVYTLSWLSFNPVSQFIFIFFLAIVSFISFRINQTAHMYTLSEERQNVKSVMFDFFFMPFIHLGRQLTENISKLNLVLFFFDLIIETPFKVLFSFFEQWFFYLRTQREKLG
jgi:hypothetical protein